MKKKGTSECLVCRLMYVIDLKLPDRCYFGLICYIKTGVCIAGLVEIYTLDNKHLCTYLRRENKGPTLS